MTSAGALRKAGPWAAAPSVARPPVISSALAGAGIRAQNIGHGPQSDHTIDFDILWTRSNVVQFSLLWDRGAASTQANLLGISAPYLLPVYCHI